MRGHWPRGYEGRQHETMGSGLLAVMSVVSMPQQTLGALSERLSSIRADAWYPVSLMLELLETLEERVGAAGMKSIGRRLFQRSHEAWARGQFSTASELFLSLDAMYRRTNRGQAIGGWSVLSIVPGEARLEKTTPHPCSMEEGIVTSALGCLHLSCTVVHEQCVRHGDDSCVFWVSSSARDARWGTPVPLRPSGRADGEVVDPARLPLP